MHFSARLNYLYASVIYISDEICTKSLKISAEIAFLSFTLACLVYPRICAHLGMTRFLDAFCIVCVGNELDSVLDHGRNYTICQTVTG